MKLSKKQKAHVLKVSRERLRLKVNMERPFIRELKSYFYKQSKNILAGRRVETISNVLDKQYSRIVKNLTGIKLKQDEDFGLGDAIILMLLGRATTQALIIDKTTQKILNRALEIARVELSADGILFPSTLTLNKTAVNIFRTLNRSRPFSIAISETQMLTENIQNIKTNIGNDMLNQAIFENDQELAREAADMMDSITAKEVSEDIGIIPASVLFESIRVIMKAWVTMGDSKVRPTHQKANFQTVPINEPFTVGNSLLMYPGDTSLGAEMSEIYGCRCSSVNM